MEPETVERWSRAVAGGISRRQATGRIGGGGMLAALGVALGLRPRFVAAADSQTCEYDLVADLRAGPSRDDEKLAHLEGRLTLSLGADGAIDSGTLATADGGWSVVGQADGRAISLWIERDADVLIALGAGKRAVARCRGDLRGGFTGPGGGDDGDWQATVRTGATVTPSPTATSRPGSAPTAIPAADQPTAVPCDLTCAHGTTGGVTSDCGCVCQGADTSLCIRAGDDGAAVGECVQIFDDPLNCGACGLVCPDGEHVAEIACVSGDCDPYCDDGFRSCDAANDGPCFTDLTSDPANCGDCGKACPFNFVCVQGVCACSLVQTCLDEGWDRPADDCQTCVCATGFSRCGPRCVDLLSDPDNCGACDDPCSSAFKRFCVFGECSATQL